MRDSTRFSVRDNLASLATIWATSRAWLLVVYLSVLVVKHLHPLTPISTWDVQHFMAIARSGYATKESYAFFPGLPGLMSLGAKVGISFEVTGVLVALVGSALAAAALVRLGGVPAAALWLIAPTTVFTFVGYTEAPFCAAAFWAWERWRKGHWLSGASLAAIACTFRVSGIFLIGGLALLVLVGDNDAKQVRPAGLEDRLRALRWLLLPVGVLVAHAWHLHLITGSWLAWYQAQVAGWNRGLTPPLEALQHTITAAKPSSWPGRAEVPIVFALEIVSIVVGLVTTIVLLRLRRWASAGWVGVQVIAFATSYWYMSVNRAVLLWFPLFVLLGSALQWRPGGEGSARAKGWQVVCAVGVVLSALVAGAWAWLLFTNGWAS